MVAAYESTIDDHFSTISCIQLNGLQADQNRQINIMIDDQMKSL